MSVRIRSVLFEPFGALRGVELDFGPVAGPLQVVWGPNEAGKSTALRGIVDFFFGIPRDSSDQHERGVELRIRMRLVVDDDRELDLVRRKGSKDPLRCGATDAPVAERDLTRWMGGVDRDTFKQLHALDHVRLREGADSILRGEGRLGELMLEATSGATGLVDRLQALRDEADALYRPRAKSTELSVAIEGWKSATRAMGQESLSHTAWNEQERGIAETRQRVMDADQKLKDARIDLAKLEKLVLLEDPLARLRHRRMRRAQLGPVADVPEGTALRRDELAHEIATASGEAERAEAELPRLAVELESTRTRASAVSLDFDRAGAQARSVAIVALGRAIADATTELGDMGRVRDEALEQLGPPPEGLAWSARAVDARSLTRAETCAAERRAARIALAAAERAHVEAEARIHAATPTDAHSAAAGRDAQELASALAALRRASAAASSLDGLAAREIELTQRLGVALADVGESDQDALAAASVPHPAVIDDELRRRGASEAKLAATERDLLGAGERAARAVAELASLREGGAVPSAADLAAAREQRDDAMSQAFEALDTGALDVTRRALRTAEQSQRAADTVADRLRHEASRVEHFARVDNERRDAQQAASALEIAAAQAKRARAAGEAEFATAWPALAVVPLEAARGWLARRSEALGTAAELSATRTRIEEVRSELRQARAHLLVVGAGSNALDESPSKLVIDAAIASAESRLDQERTAERRREERAGIHARATSDRDVAASNLDHARSIDDAADKAFRQAIGPHQLGAPQTTEEALATLIALAAATRETRRHDRLASRVGQLRGELAVAQQQWSDATSRAGLEGVEPDEVLRRAEVAREARADVPRIEEAIAQRRDVANAARARADRASGRLADLAQRAGVPDDHLAAAEQRARDARALEREIAGLESTVIEMTATATLVEAEAHVRGVDFTVTSERTEQLRADIDALEASRTRDLHDIGAQLTYLEQMERGSGSAADLAETAQAHLTRARGLARRAAVARAAVALLEREIERHRAEREGPVLRRASDLFRLLTAERWSGLRVGDGDDGGPEIRCVRGERERSVKELSEGTRDQLYLALRLAALEHHARAGVALPLVLDDVLVHFDDQRTEAALIALAEVGKTVQVLLFTHEQRVAEIARRVLGQGSISLHELGRMP